MADIFTHFRNKFARNPELVETKKPLEEKAFERPATEITAYERWKASQSHFTMLLWVREQLMSHLSAAHNTHDGIDFYANGSSRGFRMHPALTSFKDAAITHFFNFLKAQLVDQGYKSTLSDTRIFGRGYWDETIHRHVLKPHTEGGYNFAQITIELVLKNDKLVSLRFDTRIPSTDMPRPTDDFAELLQAILV